MPTQKYRFSVINLCDTVYSKQVTQIVNIDPDETDLIFGTHQFTAGDFIMLEGFSPDRINAFNYVLAGDPTSVGISINKINGIDEFMLGTVYKLRGKQYVSPQNFFKGKYTWDKDTDNIFFRKHFSGKLVFDEKEDWSYMLSKVLPNDCCKCIFMVEKRCPDLDISTEDSDTIRAEQDWIEDWRGYFTNNMGKWNMDNCNVEMDFEIEDPYTCTKATASEGVNPLPVIETHEYVVRDNSTLEETTCCFDIAHDDAILMGLCLLGGGSIFNGCSFEYDQDHSINDCRHNLLLDNFPTGWQGACGAFGGGIKRIDITGGGLTMCLVDENQSVCVYGHFCVTWIREVIVTFDVGGIAQPPPVGTGNAWHFAESLTIVGYAARKWWRLPLNYQNQTPDLLGEILKFEMWCDNGGNDIHFDFNTTPNGYYQTPEDQVLLHLRKYDEMVQYVAGNLCPDIRGVRSDFFEMNPYGDTTGYVAGTNYVTGQPNKLKNMGMIALSDFLNPNADQAAFIGKITFQDLELMWRILFNAYWFIDNDNYIRVEHISWFSRNPTADTRIGFNKFLNAGNNIFSYDRSNIPLRQEYKLHLAANYDFVGEPIKYNSFCTDQKKIEQNTDDFLTTDIDGLQVINPDDDAEGYVLVCLDPSDTQFLDRENGKITTIIQNNGHLSWANLHYNYHRHYRWLSKGNMNGIDTNFLSTRKSKRQEGVKLQKCCGDINPLLELMQTEIGNGAVDKMEQSTNDGVITFDLLY